MASLPVAAATANVQAMKQQRARRLEERALAASARLSDEAEFATDSVVAAFREASAPLDLEEIMNGSHMDKIFRVLPGMGDGAMRDGGGGGGGGAGEGCGHEWYQLMEPGGGQR